MPIEPIKLTVTDSAWGEYYGPITEMIRAASIQPTSSTDGPPLTSIEGVDLSVGAHPDILPLLLKGEWQRAQMMSLELQPVFEGMGYRPDGLIIKSGRRWRDFRDDSKRG